MLPALFVCDDDAAKAVSVWVGLARGDTRQHFGGEQA